MQRSTSIPLVANQLPPATSNLRPNHANTVLAPQADSGIGERAADVGIRTRFAHPAQVATASAPLSAVSTGTADHLSRTQPHPLRTDLPFDTATRDSTRIYQQAINVYEKNANAIFFRPRALMGKSDQHAYASFRKERRQAKDSEKSSPVDVSKRDAYSKLSENRKNQAQSNLDPLNGNSPLEEHLPKNSPFRRLLEPELGSIRDVTTGLNAQLERREGKPPTYILTFPGTQVVNTAGAQWKANIQQFLGFGGVPKMYRQAVELAREIQKEISTMDPKPELKLCGHSLGGGIASYVGLSLGMEAVGFNSAPLGPACMTALRKANALTPERLGKLKQIRTQGDPVSGRTVNTLLAGLMYGDGLFGMRAPQLLGTVFTISRESSNPFNTEGSTIARHTMSGFTNAYSNTGAAQSKTPKK